MKPETTIKKANMKNRISRQKFRSAAATTAALLLTVGVSGQSVTLQDDPGMDNQVQPGDTLPYTVEITAPSSPTLANASFQIQNLDPNTAFVAGSLMSTAIAVPADFTVVEDTPTILTLVGIDPDGDTLNFSIVTPPSGSLGTFTFVSAQSQSIEYTPPMDSTAPDSFTFQVQDDDANTDTSPVAITITPVNDPPDGIDHMVDAIGNTELVANTGGLAASANGAAFLPNTTTNLLSGATDIDGGGPIQAVPATGMSTQGGVFEVFADGSFTYTPPPGFTGSADTFTYELTDGLDAGPPSTVTANVTDMVWYLNNTDPAGTGGNGTSIAPFDDMMPVAAGDGSDVDEPGEIIHVARGDGTATGYTGIVLEENQALVGEGVALVVNSEILLIGNPLARPLLSNPIGATIETALTNGIFGLNIESGAGAGILRSGGAGMLNILEVSITGSGSGLDIDGGQLNATIDLIDVSLSTPVDAGIRISNVTGGTVTIPSLSVTGNGQGLNIQNSMGSSSITDLQISSGAADGVVIDNGGTVEILGGEVTTSSGRGAVIRNTTLGAGGVTLKSLTTSTSPRVLELDGLSGPGTFNMLFKASGTNTTGDAIFVQNNAVPVNIGFPVIDNSVSNQRAIVVANNSQTIASNTGNINSGTAAALTATDSPLAMDLDTVTQTNGLAPAISLTNTTGFVEVHGDGDSRRTGVPGTVVANLGSGGTISGNFGNAVEATNAEGLTLRHVEIISSLGSGIFASGLNGLTLDNVDVNGAGNDGIDLQSCQNLFMRNCAIRNVGIGDDQHGLNAGSLTGGVNGLTGTAMIQDTLFDNFGDRGISLFNLSGNLAWTVDTCQISNNNGNLFATDGVRITPTSSASITALFTNTTFLNLAGSGLIADPGSNIADTASLDLTVENSTFTGTQDSTNGMLRFLPFTTGKSRLLVDSCSFTPMSNAQSVFIRSVGDGEAHATIINSTITGDGTNFSNGMTAGLVTDGASNPNALMFLDIGATGSNMISGYAGNAISLAAFKSAGDASRDLHATVQNNTINGISPSSTLSGIELFADSMSNMVAEISSNTVDAEAVDGIVVSQSGSSTVELPGIAGTTSTDAENLLNANNTLGNPASASGTFADGAAPTLPELPATP